MTKSSLPKIRIVVEPYEGIYNRWEWEVQKSVEYKGHDIWLTAGFLFHGGLSGTARTKEKALAKARKNAAKFCEALLDETKRPRPRKS